MPETCSVTLTSAIAKCTLPSQTDSISVSKEAVEKAEAYYLDKVAAETPNVRADRIAEVKAKIKDPSYLSDEVILSTAEKVMSGFGI